MNFLKYPVVSGILFLTGCALTPDQATQLTPIDLCERYYFGNSSSPSAQVIYREVNRRGSSYCDQFRDVVLAREKARREQDAAVLGALLGASAILNATQPPPTPTVIQQTAPKSCRVTKNPYGDRIDCF
jgi:hypothetical protein